MRIRITILIVFLAVSILSCIDTIDLGIPSGEGSLVVYGLITNESTPQSIKLYRSTDFQDVSPYPPVNDAQVYLLDRLGSRIEFTEDDNSGVYYSPDDFNVIPGDAFELHVITNEGEHIVSTQEAVKPLSPIISVNTIPVLSPEEYSVDPLADNYYVSALIDDDEGVSNYYRWKIYVNGELRGLASEMILFDDTVADGILFRYSAGNVRFKENDIISLKYYSLTVNAYRFFELIQDQTEYNTLDTSAPEPVSIESNLININDEGQIVLGLFSAAEVELIDDIEIN